MYQLKVHINYIESYLESSEFTDRSINIFLAIASSSSICGWAIWQQYDFVWAFIIALSQLVTVIKRFLPYRARIKPLAGILHEFEEIMIYAELKWFDVSEGNLTDEEVHKLQFKVKSSKSKSLKKFLPLKTLPLASKRFIKAEEVATKYFENFYA